MEIYPVCLLPPSVGKSPIESKFSQVCYFMHMLGYTKWEYRSLTISAFKKVKLLILLQHYNLNGTRVIVDGFHLMENSARCFHRVDPFPDDFLSSKVVFEKEVISHYNIWIEFEQLKAHSFCDEVLLISRNFDDHFHRFVILWICWGYTKCKDWSLTITEGVQCL